MRAEQTAIVLLWTTKGALKPPRPTNNGFKTDAIRRSASNAVFSMLRLVIGSQFRIGKERPTITLPLKAVTENRVPALKIF